MMNLQLPGTTQDSDAGKISVDQTSDNSTKEEERIPEAASSLGRGEGTTLN